MRGKKCGTKACARPANIATTGASDDAGTLHQFRGRRLSPTDRPMLVRHRRSFSLGRDANDEPPTGPDKRVERARFKTGGGMPLPLVGPDRSAILGCDHLVAPRPFAGGLTPGFLFP